MPAHRAEIDRPARPAPRTEDIQPRRPGDQRGPDGRRPQHVAPSAQPPVPTLDDQFRLDCAALSALDPIRLPTLKPLAIIHVVYAPTILEDAVKTMLMSVAILIAGATLASAEDVKVEKKVEERPGVSVQVPLPGVGVERRERVETTGRGAGCDTKSVTKEGVGESKTVTKSNC
jgi:hypothetical protein